MMPSRHGPTVVIDAMNTFLRNYCRSPYLSSDGERAGGLSGMVISVRKLIADNGASNVLVVWDGEGGSQRRKAIYSNYKAGRTVRLNRREDDMEEDPERQLANLRWQRDVAQEYLTMLGVPQVRCDGVEADDLMAYVSTIDQPGGCVLVTTDQDLLQLIRAPGPSGSSEVKVWSPVKKVMYDRPRFISDYGVLPENFRFMKALSGDDSDNIEGVKGFGVKTVAKGFPFLAERTATADEVLSAELKGVLGKRLQEQKSRFLENLTLVDLSSPMLSATAARQAREALAKDMGCREVEFRVRIIRDGITFSGDGFVGPFRDMVNRRRRLLAEHSVKEEDTSTDE